MNWYQKELSFATQPGKVILITHEVLTSLPEIKMIQVGFLHLFLKHTSASLSINENADSDVRSDLSHGLSYIVPDNLPYRHTAEGPDDMPAHIKASLIGVSLQIPIASGCLQLGTWQGIYLCEHRLQKHTRRLVATVYGLST